MDTHRWEPKIEDTVHFIEYVGTTPAGEAKIVVDGESGAYNLSLTIESRYRAFFSVAGHAAILEMDTNGESVRLLVDDVVQAGSTVPAPAAVAASTEVPPDVAKLERRIKGGMGSLATIVILSLVNAVLYLANATISFPFSIFASTLAVGFGQGFAEETGSNVYLVVGIVAGLLIIAAYAFLYFLAKKRTWPVWTALGLVVFDTLLLLFVAFSSGGFADSLIDIAFHAWILVSLVSLGLARGKLRRIMEKSVAAASGEPGADTPTDA